ncbi:hypothetical protein MAPG_01877 [Magnaporthiopsis poae ATCC 64411]|uniref:Uncharacterized protein n=1 Tax=Magnaporthiopsis poae (strain ATCC 64411 / 73-15) TaxID=644358 RepID=A0A0C4DPU9_MAGP6|nr:hypothetical protein MAPG_01877 [Magnaporthiopsis poae ATCC 64411]
MSDDMSRPSDAMEVSIVALGHSQADTPAIVDPAAACLPGATIRNDTPPGHRLLLSTREDYSFVSVADLGVAAKQLSADTSPSELLKAVTAANDVAAVLYVADLASYHHLHPAAAQDDQGTGQSAATTTTTHIQDVLKSFRTVRAWCRTQKLDTVVLLRGVKAFKDDLGAHPLEGCFGAGYSWIDDKTNAQDLGAPMGLDALVRRMCTEEGGAVSAEGDETGPKLYFHYVRGDRASEEDVDVVVNAIKDILRRK